MKTNRRSFLQISTASVSLLGAFTVIAQAQTETIKINTTLNRRNISPQIYGVNYGENATAVQKLNSPLNRRGSTAETRYNWQQNAFNAGNDWYFESIAHPSAVPGAYYDSFIQNNRTIGADSMVTIPLIGWAAKLGANRSPLASFLVSKYGAQTDHDPNGWSDAGNGVLAKTGKPVTGNNPSDANVAVTSAFQKTWVQSMVNKFGKAQNGGVRYFLMDNEPSIWHQSHRDVKPIGAKMQEVRDKILEYGNMVKSVDPTAQVVGPEEWGWSGYFSSGYDQQYEASHGYPGVYPDKTAQGGMDYAPWLLDQMRQAEARTGKRVLDVFSLHYYPQAGEFGNDVSDTMQKMRNRSTRALWDPNYTEESWIADKVNLIPRMKNWVNTYYPGTKIGLTEYSWGADNHINGATTQADVLGILGREGADMACRWMMPDPSTPTYKAIQMYRNYDGKNSTFGNVSVSAIANNPDSVSAFAAIRTADNTLTIMVINKTTEKKTINIDVKGPTRLPKSSEAWRLTAGNRIVKVVEKYRQNWGQLPPQSITLWVVRY